MTLLPLTLLGAVSGVLCGLLWALPPDVPPPQRDPIASGAAQKAPQPKIKRDAQRQRSLPGVGDIREAKAKAKRQPADEGITGSVH